MRNYFTFNGTDSRDYGLYISGTGRIQIPDAGYEFVQIPGRPGDLIPGKPRAMNELLTYPAFIPPYYVNGVLVRYPEMVSRLRSWLLSEKGYKVLVDSYDPAHYRLACFTGPTAFESTIMLNAGSFELSFNCKPQRYLVDESDAFTLAAGATRTVSKPGFFYSEPLINVTGNGSFSVGDVEITVAENSLTGPIAIDCRLMDCYDANGVNANRYVAISGFEFPVIEDGTVVDAGDVALAVNPRWYEL